MTNDELCTFDLMERGQLYVFSGGTIDGPYDNLSDALDDIEEDFSSEFGMQTSKGVVLKVIAVKENTDD